MKDKEKKTGKGAPQHGRGEHPNSKAQLHSGSTGKGFETHKKGGAPKTAGIVKFISETLQKEVKPAQIDVACACLLGCSLAELERIYDRSMQGQNDTPVLVGIVAQRLIQDVKSGDIEGLMKIIDRVAGKPRQAVEVQGKVSIEPLKLDKLSEGELDALTQQLGLLLESEDDAQA